MPILKKISKNISNINRFIYDPRIPKSKIEKLYEKWIENSHKGTMADNILVAINKNNTPIGFITYKFFEEIKKCTGSKIIGHGLLSVSQNTKGAGISLVKKLSEITSKNYNYAEYDSVLNNYQAINIWQKFNFYLIRCKHIFHLWIK